MFILAKFLKTYYAQNEMITNKVKNSGIISFDLIDYMPSEEIIEFDLKNLLYEEMILVEKEFKTLLAHLDYTQYKSKIIAFVCSVDTIIPSWAYMYLTAVFHEHSTYLDFKSADEIKIDIWTKNILEADLYDYIDQKVVIRARADFPPSLYMVASSKLIPIVTSLMYGEAGMPKVIFKNK